jgi:hypothetical protein
VSRTETVVPGVSALAAVLAQRAGRAAELAAPEASTPPRSEAIQVVVEAAS